MAIRGLKTGTITEFKGKSTSQNLTNSEAGTMLSAKNVMVLADNQVRRAPGYTLVLATGLGQVHNIFNFERNVDSAQFIVAHVGTSIIAMQPDGTGLVTLSAGESSTPFQFVQNSFICYASNGIRAYRFVDVGGMLTKYQWGIDAPVTAPSIATSAGTLTLTYGRRYCFSYVAKYTDSLGIQRVSVGPPSALSAHSGPVAGAVVELSNMDASTDPQVGFKWIWETSDSVIDTSATFYFAAEIPNSQLTYGDELLDSDLDDTRLAPFDNNPAPPAPILTTFQNRVVAISDNQIRLSGYGETPLGIPEENWPIDLFFNIPAGSRKATAAISLGDGSQLAVCTETAWYGYTGYDATTFTEADNIAQPGAVGKFALTETPYGIAFLSRSKRLFLWAAGGRPTEVSSAIAQQVPGTYGMEDLDPASLENAVVRWYSYGKMHFLAVFARTTDAPDAALNLIQLWSFPVKGEASSGQYSGSSSFFNQLAGLYQTDKIPADTMTAAANVKVNSVPYLFTGDALGNIYRFPDGFQDNGLTSIPTFSTAWSSCDTEGKKRFMWVDLVFQCPASLLASGGALNNVKVWASVAGSPLDNPIPQLLDIQLLPFDDSQYSIRANLQVTGLNFGKYIRLWVTLPSDANDQGLLKLNVWFVPVYQGMP